jgi:hypothetical protein
MIPITVGLSSKDAVTVLVAWAMPTAASPAELFARKDLRCMMVKFLNSGGEKREG